MLLFLLLTLFADSSWVRIRTMPTEVILVLNEDLAKPIAHHSGDSLLLPVGKHTIRITHPLFGDGLRNIDLPQDKTLNLAIDLRFNRIPIPNTQSTWFVLRNQANVVVETDAETRIFVNGNDMGQGTARVMIPYDEPTANIELRLGSKRTTIPINLTTNRSMYVNQYMAPDRLVSWILSPLPGLTQAYEQSYSRALLIAAATAGGVYVLHSRNDQYQRRQADYQVLRNAYFATSDFNEAEQLGLEMRAFYPHVERAAQLRDISAYALGALFAVHLVDVAIPPKYGFRKLSVRPHPYRFVGAEIRLGL
jgi:hypothetical protein